MPFKFRESDDDLTIATTWGVVFNHNSVCPATQQQQGPATSAVATSRRRLRDTPAIPQPSAPSPEQPMDSQVHPRQVLQGLEVVFSNEDSDVMVLRLNNPIPETYDSYFLGWDASGILFSKTTTPKVAIHHPLGDVQKMATSTAPLKNFKWRTDAETHLLAKWGAAGGGTQDGSSGAALVDIASEMVLGVLTGGTTARNCSNNADLFGSLAVAWDQGLRNILHPGYGSFDVTLRTGSGRPGRPRSRKDFKNKGEKESENSSSRLTDGGTNNVLTILPSKVVVMERSTARAVVEVSLIDVPGSNELIEVVVSLVQAPASAAKGGIATGAAAASNSPPVTLLTSQLLFNISNWNISQNIVLFPGDDDIEGGPEPFQLIFTAHSMVGKERPRLLEKKIVPGLRTDDELLPGWSFEDPVVINRELEGGINTQELGLLDPIMKLQKSNGNSTGGTIGEGGTADGTVNSTSTNTTTDTTVGQLVSSTTPKVVENSWSSGSSNGGSGTTGLVHLGDPLEHQASTPLGSATYYNITVSQKAVLNMQACGDKMVPQVVMYAGNKAAWWVVSNFRYFYWIDKI